MAGMGFDAGLGAPGPDAQGGPSPDRCHRSLVLKREPYKFIGFGNIHGPKPYKFTGFGNIHGPKTYRFIGFGNTYRFIGFGK